MKTKPKKKQVERVNEFHCCEQAFKHKEFVEHITTAHGFVKGTQCTRSLVQAIDGSGFYSNTFELAIPCGDAKSGYTTIKVTQVNSGPRERGGMWSEGDE